jgi:hypothetical protein
MKIEILDEDNKVISELSPGKTKGINIVQWNYRHRAPKIAAGKTVTRGGFAAPMVPPGTYKVRMTKGKEVYESSVAITPDPDSPYSQQELKEGYDAAMRLYNMNEQLAYIVDQIDNVSDGVDKLKGKDLPKKLKNDIATFGNELSDLKEPLVIMTGDNYVGAAEPQLREKIANIYGDVASYPGKPSKGQVETMKYLDKELQVVQGKFNEKIEKLNQINEQLEKAGLEKISLRSIEDFIRA